MVRFARRLGFPVLSLVCVITLGWPHYVRTSLYRTFYPLVSLDETVLASPPEELQAVGYRAISADELPVFRQVAAPVVQGISDDGARLRRLADLIYSYHRGPSNEPVIAGGRERGVQAIFADMQAGNFALCGHKTLVLSAMWRSLGGHVRQIRFTSGDDVAWFAAHYGIEVYSTVWQKWFYFDATLNGYPVEPSGEPMSLLELDKHLAAGDDVEVVASHEHFDWTADQFLSFLRTNGLQVYSLNNQLRSQDPDHRFGWLNFAYPVLSKLPRPLDRVADTLTGGADPRFIAHVGATAPSVKARVHLSAIPFGPTPFQSTQPPVVRAAHDRRPPSF